MGRRYGACTVRVKKKERDQHPEDFSLKQEAGKLGLVGFVLTITLVGGLSLFTLISGFFKLMIR